MNNKRIITVITAVVLTAASIAAQQAVEPTAARLQQDISYLASDALDGRRTGTAGANDAARYIAGEFARAGLRTAVKAAGSRRPSAEMARYLQAFPYVAGARLGQQNLLTARMNGAVFNFEVGKDWMPLGISANQTLERVPVVFVKYGITAAELNYNDYSDPKIAGRIAIAQSGTPDGDNPHGQFGQYEDVHWKAIAARNAGAKALFVIAREKNFADDRLSVLRIDNTAGDAGIPVIGISQKAAADLLTNDVPWLINLSTNITREEVPAYNVVGVLEGSDLILK